MFWWEYLKNIYGKDSWEVLQGGERHSPVWHPWFPILILVPLTDTAINTNRGSHTQPSTKCKGNEWEEWETAIKGPEFILGSDSSAAMSIEQKNSNKPKTWMRGDEVRLKINNKPGPGTSLTQLWLSNLGSRDGEAW